MANFPSLGHIALTVTDLSRSVPWYQRLFDADPHQVAPHRSIHRSNVKRAFIGTHST